MLPIILFFAFAVELSSSNNFLAGTFCRVREKCGGFDKCPSGTACNGDYCKFVECVDEDGTFHECYSEAAFR